MVLAILPYWIIHGKNKFVEVSINLSKYRS